jgi:hypothetical protein
MVRRSTFLRYLLGEARASLLPLLLLLLVPVLHPVAEAHALSGKNAQIICSSFGGDNANSTAFPDDMPNCIVCAVNPPAMVADGQPFIAAPLTSYRYVEYQKRPAIGHGTIWSLPQATGPPAHL